MWFRESVITIGLIIAIFIATTFSIYYIQSTLRQVEAALPVKVVDEKNEIRRLTHNLSILLHNIHIHRRLPEQRNEVMNQLDAVKNNMTLIRDSYRFDNILGAAAFHAAIYPALIDIDNWLTNGIYHLAPESDVVLSIVEQRVSDVYEEADRLLLEADRKAFDVLSSQAHRIKDFRVSSTVLQILEVLLGVLLVHFMLRQRKANRLLHQSEERFRDFADIVSDYVWETDADLRFTYLSSGYEKISGLPVSSVLHRTRREVWGVQDAGDLSWESHYRALETHQPIEGFKMRWKRPDGETRTLYFVGKPMFDSDERFIGYRGGVKDITDLTRAQQAAEQSQRTAEAANAAKTNFLANVSHEIRTPMTLILGMSDRLSESKLDNEQKRLLRIVRDAGESLLNLINRILDVSKIESGHFSLSNKSFNIKSTVESICDAYQDLCHKKSLSITTQIASDVRLIQLGDRYRLEQVLRNLIDNAIKFSANGVITVSIENNSEKKQKNCLKFSVQDSGKGIAKDRQQEIFQAFVQEDSSPTRDYRGTGLGLAICDQIVKMMGGSIWVESGVGEGSIFHFTVVFEDLDEAQVDLFPATDAHLKDLPAMDILLVEDDEIIAMLVKEYLSKTKARVVSVENGLEGVNAYKADDYDLILMDLLMPVLDGYSATKEIRNWEQINNKSPVPIIALSASVLTEDIERCLEAGFSSHVSKPILRENLFKIVRDSVKEA